MPVTVRIIPVPEPVKVTIKPKTPPPTITLELDIRKSLSGDLMIFDHGDIDIVLSGKDKKITAFPKQVVAGVEDEYIDPDKTDSTELGEVPQRDEQGSIRPGYGPNNGYAMSYMYPI